MRKFKQSASTADYGWHNQNLGQSIERLHRGQTYKNLSTVWITPTRGQISARIISSWMGLMKPMNQICVGPVFIENMEVGDAYNHAVEMILNNPELAKCKYLLSVEEDNAPPQDGLLLLYESMDKFDAVSGLYWTKFAGGQPMCYGSPDILPKNFIPQPPPVDCVKEYNGLGMGFCLFKISMFKKLSKPWFKTLQSPTLGSATQDLFFSQQAAKEGFRFAVDGRVKVGHWDQPSQMMW